MVIPSDTAVIRGAPDAWGVHGGKTMNDPESVIAHASGNGRWGGLNGASWLPPLVGASVD
jgi:hypothetical protein